MLKHYEKTFYLGKLPKGSYSFNVYIVISDMETGSVMDTDYYQQPFTVWDYSPKLMLKTDKDMYKLGENVKITLINVGNHTVTEGGYPPWQIFACPEETPVFPFVFATLIWSLDPGENDTLTWNQYNEFNGSFCGAGDYVVKDNKGWGLSSYFRIVDADIIVPDDYSTIQGAINAASNEDTVLVRAGRYCEGIVVNKSITLTGEDKPTTIIDANYDFVIIICIMADNVTVRGFTVQNNKWMHSTDGGGIFISGCNGSVIVDNIIKDNQFGLNLWRSTSHNLVTDNVFLNNSIAINSEYDSATDCTIYHNNFVDNSIQAAIWGGAHTWDDGYPSGGNFWNDYAGVDSYSGPFQNETGSDGIADTPYVMNEENIDKYPLMLPWKWTLLGDINCDFKVDIKDVAVAAMAFGSYPGHPRWTHHADITGPTYLVPDGKIDIRDIALIAMNFGNTYP